MEEFQVSVWRLYFLGGGRWGRLAKTASGSYLTVVGWAHILETPSPGLQLQLGLLEHWVWDKLLHFLETRPPRLQAGGDHWSFPSQRGAYHPLASYQEVVSDFTWKQNLSQYRHIRVRVCERSRSSYSLDRGDLVLPSSAGPHGPLPLPYWTPHPSLPRCFSWLVIFQISEDNYFFQEAFSWLPDQVGSNVFSLSWPLLVY